MGDADGPRDAALFLLTSRARGWEGRGGLLEEKAMAAKFLTITLRFRKNPHVTAPSRPIVSSSLSGRKITPKAEPLIA